MKDYTPTAAFWRRLEALLKVGLPFGDALSSLYAHLSDPAQRQWVHRVLIKLETGLSFSQSVLGLDATSKGLLVAAEQTGEMISVVGALAQRAEEGALLRAQVRSALTYPTIVAVVCFALWMVLAVVVIPRFSVLFASLGLKGDLPALSRWVISLGQWLAAGGWLLGGGFIVLLFVGARFCPPAVLWKIPFWGRLMRQGVGVEVLEGLALLTKHQIGLDQALEMALGAGGFKAEICARVGSQIAEGEAIDRSLQKTELFEREDLDLLRLAQQTGSIEQTSQRLARLHRERYRLGLKQLVAIIEPVLVIVMALSVAILVGALFAPLLPLVSHLSEGV